MMTDEKLHSELSAINRNVGELSVEIRNFRNEYEDGKERARACAKEMNQKIDDVRIRLSRKVDKAEIAPLLKLNWVFANWKLFLIASAVISAVIALLELKG